MGAHHAPVSLPVEEPGHEEAEGEAGDDVLLVVPLVLQGSEVAGEGAMSVGAWGECRQSRFLGCELNNDATQPGMHGSSIAAAAAAAAAQAGAAAEYELTPAGTREAGSGHLDARHADPQRPQQGGQRAHKPQRLHGAVKHAEEAQEPEGGKAQAAGAPAAQAQMKVLTGGGTTQCAGMTAGRATAARHSSKAGKQCTPTHLVWPDGNDCKKGWEAAEQKISMGVLYFKAKQLR